MKPFQGKTAIVTGASSGIGRAIALTLARQGAAVALHARREALLREVADEIRQGGGRALIVAGDAGQASAIDALLEAVLAWQEGGCAYSTVIANAGRGLAGGITTSDNSQWQELYQTNVLGTAHLLRQTGRYLSQQGSGDIVVLSSVADATSRRSAVFMAQANSPPLRLPRRCAARCAQAACVSRL